MANMTARPFNAYSEYLRKTFNGRVQKISINTGYSCPNRDGTKGVGGCTYCNINSIQPSYAQSSKSVTNQLREGVAFFSRKSKNQKFLAYFQSYTNTYQKKEALIDAYQEALNFPGVIGLVIATRPDSIDSELIDYLAFLTRKSYIAVELGIESTLDKTLEQINRCHTYSATVDAFELLSEKNILSGGHLILGFPWESRSEMLLHAERISELPLTFLKLHHLQILRHTKLAKDFESPGSKYALLELEEYLSLTVEFLEKLRQDIIIQRFISESPLSLLIAPHWKGVKNYAFSSLIEKKMLALKTWQGRLWQGIV